MEKAVYDRLFVWQFAAEQSSIRLPAIHFFESKTGPRLSRSWPRTVAEIGSAECSPQPMSKMSFRGMGIGSLRIDVIVG